MKRLLSLAIAATVLATPLSASAQSVNYQTDIQKLFKINLDLQPYKSPLLVEKQTDSIKIEVTEPKAVAPTVTEAPKPVVYTVVAGDTLSSIGTAYNVEWQRLWAKNTQLTNPDVILVGDLITIPEPSEALQRDLPAVVALPAQTPGVAPYVSYDGSNSYDYGYCTWYVKNKRGASLPNGLGNANQWYWNAQRTGLPVGTEPRPGAVGTTTRGSLGHVVYVESVDGDGTITISEMNAAAGWGHANTRTASPSEFVYIY